MFNQFTDHHLEDEDLLRLTLLLYQIKLKVKKVKNDKWDRRGDERQKEEQKIIILRTFLYFFFFFNCTGLFILLSLVKPEKIKEKIEDQRYDVATMNTQVQFKLL